MTTHEQFRSIIKSDSFFSNFSEKNFFKLCGIPIEESKDCFQLHYITRYLKGLKCNFMILESYYTDKYYLDDYLHFYGNCHKKYKRKCKRIHFFKKKFDTKKLFSLTYPESEEFQKNLQEIYLGFTVIRPIPDSHVGRTLLSVFSDTNTCIEKGNMCDCRNIIAIQNYNANLFGYKLSVNSVPFQQQDNVVHACATTAIWSVLSHSTQKFKYYTPTPYEIKESTTQSSPILRPIPTSGLSNREIINSIRFFGLETEIGNFEDFPRFQNFSSYLYAFLRGGFPILLTVDIFRIKENSDIDDDMELVGGHAMGVFGYNLQEKQPDSARRLLTGNKIDKLYIHDDNLGPFSRYYIEEYDDSKLIMRCEDRNNGEFDDIIVPDLLIAPVYHKIRYPYKEIINLLSDLLDLMIRFIFSDEEDDIYEDKNKIIEKFRNVLEWDVYLTTTEDLKKTYLKCNYFKSIEKELRKKILTGYFPRFIWRCTLYNGKIPILEILGDATEAQTQFPFFCSFLYHKEDKEAFEKLFSWLKRDYFKKILI